VNGRSSAFALNSSLRQDEFDPNLYSTLSNKEILVGNFFVMENVIPCSGERDFFVTIWG
jgi:hypothetical protein